MYGSFLIPKGAMKAVVVMRATKFVVENIKTYKYIQRFRPGQNITSA